MYDIDDIVYGIVLVEPNIVSIMRIVIKDVLESIKQDTIMYDCESVENTDYRYMIISKHISDKIENLLDIIENLLDNND